MEDNFNGRQPQWKITAMEKDLNGSLPCLASQFCTELGPAQPQLVSFKCHKNTFLASFI